ncbi:MAG: PAS domain-containing protein, partial [Actinobacteria bacterium]
TPRGELAAGPGVIESPMEFQPDTSLEAAALHSLPMPIYVHDEERIVYANSAVLRVLGARDLASVIGQPIADLTHDDTRAAERERRAMLLAHDTVLDHVDAKGVASDGQTVYYTCRAASFQHEGRRLVTWVATGVERATS